ncbi:MAG: GMC family oxidoreductase N-terminal domain-containing protein [Acidimicrobiia bacterium]|nr:GMC family oxidoreductase N-terminal domain-containing protein [Acidimicrobiia bacterium]
MTTGADVLVVGAGSAGATLAARLSEDPSRTVELVEAGPDYTSAGTPEAIRATSMSGSLDVGALAEHYWLGVRARRTGNQPLEPYWAGKGVGGSSAINGLVAIRPPPQDFDEWASSGCRGWSWDEVLPHFVALEGDELFGDEPAHGRGGRVPIARVPPEHWSALDLAFRDALVARGVAWTPDMNAPDSAGCGLYPFNARNRRRVSTNDAYLEPARNRPNLTVRGRTLVDRLVFDGSRAVGARVVGHDGAEDLLAGEVVLCGGAVGSAAVLLRSGIGPADHLRALGIGVRADLPVGSGVQDHAGLALHFPLRPDQRQGVHRPVCAARATTGTQGCPSWPHDTFLSVVGPYGPDDQAGGALAWLARTWSRGTLRLVCSDPTVDPVLDLRLLADERDRVRFRRVARDLCALLHDAPLAGVLAAPPRARDGTPLTDIERMTDAALDRWALGVVRDVAHLSSSCPMGAPGDPHAVVDPDGRVLGAEGLRVVDASVFPSVPGANTHLAVVMAAERQAASYP